MMFSTSLLSLLVLLPSLSLSLSLPELSMTALNMAAGSNRNVTATTTTMAATVASSAAVSNTTITDGNGNNNSSSSSTDTISSSSSSDKIAKFLVTKILMQPLFNFNLEMISTRTIHSILVAMNLFWYQAIRQTVAILSVFMCVEFNGENNSYKMDTTQQGQLIAAPSVGNIMTQAFGGYIIQKLDCTKLGHGGTTTAISIALFGLAFGCTVLPLTINSKASHPLRKAFVVLALQGVLFGPMFPAHSVLLSKWLPSEERGSAMAYGEIAMSVASMIVPIVVTTIADTYTTTIRTTVAVPSTVSPPTITTTTPPPVSISTLIPGWRNGFYVTGLACFGYLLGIWNILGRNTPQSCSYISQKELDYLTTSLLSTASTTSTSATNDDDDDATPSTSTSTSTSTNENDNGATSMAASLSTATATATTRTASTSSLSLLTHPSIVSLFMVHMMYNFVTLSINSWMPTYYNDVLGLKPQQSKIHIVIPQLMSLGVKLMVSKLANTIQQQKKRATITTRSNTSASAASASALDVLLYSRRLMGYLGFLVTAIPLWFVPVVATTTTVATKTFLPDSNSYYYLDAVMSKYSPWASTLLFSMALMGTGFHAESFRANYLDVTRTHVGLISGIGNCLSSVSAMLAPFVVGTIVKQYSGSSSIGSSNSVAGWAIVWKLSSLLCLIAAFIFGSFSTTIPIEEQEQQQEQM